VKDYCKSIQPISWKLGVIYDWAYQDMLPFGNDPVPDTDSGYYFSTSVTIAE